MSNEVTCGLFSIGVIRQIQRQLKRNFKLQMISHETSGPFEPFLSYAREKH